MIFELPSTYEEFAKKKKETETGKEKEKKMQDIVKNHNRFDFLTDNYKNKASYLKLNKQATSAQSERTQIASLQSSILTEFQETMKINPD